MPADAPDVSSGVTWDESTRPRCPVPPEASYSPAGVALVTHGMHVG